MYSKISIVVVLLYFKVASTTYIINEWGDISKKDLGPLVSRVPPPGSECDCRPCTSNEDCRGDPPQDIEQCGTCDIVSGFCNEIPHFKHFYLDCNECTEACNNDCYAIYQANKPSRLHYYGSGEDKEKKKDKNKKKKKKNKKNEEKRREAGCTPNPCKTKKYSRFAVHGNSCDEYPFASTDQGGSGAILRCTKWEEDNRKEGRMLGTFLQTLLHNGGCATDPCWFYIHFTNYVKSQLCTSSNPQNDGLEFKKDARGRYVIADRGIGGSSNATFAAHAPDAVHFVPPSKRRELLLSNGVRVLSSKIDDEPMEGVVMLGQDGKTATVVKELFDDEKSPELRP